MSPALALMHNFSHPFAEILQKNVSDGVRVLEHMQSADVKPDSETFSYLISNSETEEDIVRVSWD